jgi:hypothetical protein
LDNGKEINMHSMYLHTHPTKIIAREKLNGIGEHWGVLTSNGMVAHNTQDRGPHLVTLDEFAAGKEIKELWRIPSSERQATLRRMEQALALQRPYHPTLYNCETFANAIAGHKPEILQVNGWLGLAAVVTLAVLISE